MVRMGEVGSCRCVTPKPGWSPGVCGWGGSSIPLRSEPTRKKDLSCCSGGDKTWVYFSSMQTYSPAVGKPAAGVCSVPPQTALCHLESLWLCPQVGDGWWVPTLDQLSALVQGQPVTAPCPPVPEFLFP